MLSLFGLVSNMRNSKCPLSFLIPRYLNCQLQSWEFFLFLLMYALILAFSKSKNFTGNSSCLWRNSMPFWCCNISDNTFLVDASLNSVEEDQESKPVLSFTEKVSESLKWSTKWLPLLKQLLVSTKWLYFQTFYRIICWLVSRY